VRRAIEAFRDRDTWVRLGRQGMSRDFGFSRGARRYDEAYARAVAMRRAREAEMR
jgi:glycogen synthase